MMMNTFATRDPVERFASYFDYIRTKARKEYTLHNGIS